MFGVPLDNLPKTSFLMAEEVSEYLKFFAKKTQVRKTLRSIAKIQPYLELLKEYPVQIM